ncbi:hypothetical protein B1757_13290 [Acidithiobacillus marinus]|uniref:Uncharacterized protein n=1 Tax=Acidithiobacillus marinus TaxID=187490 RepID=A0A2I1DIR6_9PROT|nr:hypothetical protein [Acidithiobacillus marinus]PKY09769.1 hypothetical protein B1757_13290 [Acidithiobacillus marinus]
MKPISTKNKGLAFGLAATVLFVIGFILLHHAISAQHQAKATFASARAMQMRNAHEMVLASRMKLQLKDIPEVMAQPLPKLLPTDVQDINRTSGAFGIKISRIDVQAKVFGGRYNAMGIVLKNLGTPMPGYPGLKDQKITIKGEWSTIDEFEQWVKYLQYIGLAVNHVAITGRNFNMSVEAVGV